MDKKRRTVTPFKYQLKADSRIEMNRPYNMANMYW